MLITLSGTVMLVSPVQPLNAAISISVTLSGMVMLVSPVQSRKAESPMIVTLSGIVMLVSPVQPRKAEEPMLVTLSGIIMLVSPVQPEKAESFIFVPPVITTSNDLLPHCFATTEAQEEEPTILVKLLQLEKTRSPMLVTPLPIATLVSLGQL